MRILDADGKPVRGNMLVTPEWLMRDLRAKIERDNSDARVLAIRESVKALIEVEGPIIGATIRVRTPRRYRP